MKCALVLVCVMYGAYGLISKDVWTVIGNHCSTLTKVRIASTCTKLRHLFRLHFDWSNWKYWQPNTGLFHAAVIGDLELINFFIAKGASDWNTGLDGAVQCTDSIVRRDLVDFFIAKGAWEWDWGLWSAAKSGHRDLVDFFISKGASSWNWALVNAVGCADSTVRRDLVELFVANGAKNWKAGLLWAKQRNDHDLILFFESKIAA